MPLNYTQISEMGLEPGRKLQTVNGGKLIVLDLVWLPAQGKNAPLIGGLRVWETGDGEREHLMNIDTIKKWMDKGVLKVGWNNEFIPIENMKMESAENEN